MKHVNFDFSEFGEFFAKVGKSGSQDFKKSMELFLIALGTEFLRILTEEIIRREVTDTRLLLKSFTKSEKDNIWKLTENNITLEVGTDLDYASYVNDGHWTCKRGETMRFVPGEFRGGKFFYIQGCDTGMILKQKWVNGKPYFDSSLRIIERIYPDLLERALQKWINDYFNM